MQVPEAIFHDRKHRRRLSRKKYGELVGLSENRVHGLEEGRKLKAGELDLLRDYIGDLLDRDVPVPDAVPGGGSGQGAGGSQNGQNFDPGTSEDQAPAGAVDNGLDTYAAERRGLIAQYVGVMNRLAGKPAPATLPWPSMYRIETCPPTEFPRLRDWIGKVHAYLDNLNGLGQVLTGDAPSEPAPQSEPESEEDEDQDQDQDEDEDEDEDEDDEAGAWYPADPISTPEEVELATEFDTTIPDDPDTETIEMVSEPPTVPVDDDLRIVTNGEMRTFKRCRRRWYLGYYRRLGVREEALVGAASVGTRVHKALAAWYTPPAGSIDPWLVFDTSVQEDATRLEERNADEKTWKKFRDEVDLARAIVEGYFEWIQEEGHDSNLEIIGAEQVAEVNPRFPYMENVRLKCKLDVKLLRPADNARLFMDHKTVGSFEQATKTLQLDEQMLTYCLIDYLACQAENDPEARTDGALYNMAHKVKRTDRATPPFYRRVEVRHSVEEMRSFWQRVMGTVQDMERTKRRLDEGEDHLIAAYPNPTRDCSWDCEFFWLCPMMDDGSRSEDFIREQLVEVNPLRRYEPELVGVTT